MVHLWRVRGGVRERERERERKRGELERERRESKGGKADPDVYPSCLKFEPSGGFVYARSKAHSAVDMAC